MTESDIVYQIDSDDDTKKMKTMASSTSRSSTPTNSSKPKRARLSFPFGACRVCSDSATGIHYGIATCEGCKGFFKRSILRKEKYRCYFDNSCLVNVTNRNRCKACRFQRCLDKGMSVDGVKMGRIPKLVKERALLEQKEQQMRQEAAKMVEGSEGSDEVPARETSCSSLSDRSIENYEPGSMETDITDMQVPGMRRNCQSSKIYSNPNLPQNNIALYNDRIINHSTIPQNSSEHNPTANFNHNQNKNSSLTYRTKYPTYLPDDFTLDETDGVVKQATGCLSNDALKHAYMISSKLSQNKWTGYAQLTDEELSLIRYLRWSSYDSYRRYSKRVKQLEVRMHQMIYNNIHEFPGDDASSSQFMATVPKTLEVTVRSSVFYIKELPGMANTNSNTLHKIILRRAFDWYMLKYSGLFHDNGQCYILSPDGFQYTRRWMNTLYGMELVNEMFKFCLCLRNLNLTESEFSLIIPLQMCCADPTNNDEDLPRILRSCYLYALYQELYQNRGEHEARTMCSKILQVLDLLVPLNEFYEKNVGSRVLEA